jgi:hypothetical protein
VGFSPTFTGNYAYVIRRDAIAAFTLRACLFRIVRCALCPADCLAYNEMRHCFHADFEKRLRMRIRLNALKNRAFHSRDTRRKSNGSSGSYNANKSFRANRRKRPPFFLSFPFLELRRAALEFHARETFAKAAKKGQITITIINKNNLEISQSASLSNNKHRNE